MWTSHRTSISGSHSQDSHLLGVYQRELLPNRYCFYKECSLACVSTFFMRLCQKTYPAGHNTVGTSNGRNTPPCRIVRKVLWELMDPIPADTSDFEPKLCVDISIVIVGSRTTGNNLKVLKDELDLSDLTDEHKAMIAGELDVATNTRNLLNFLEEVIDFFVSMVKGARRDDRNLSHMQLQTFARDFMMVEQEEFDRVSTPSVTEHMCLCHLSSLFMFLEENVNGSFYDKILPEYREQLNDEQRDEVMKAQGRLDMTILLPAMREFMLNSPGLLDDTAPKVCR